MQLNRALRADRGILFIRIYCVEWLLCSACIARVNTSNAGQVYLPLDLPLYTMSRKTRAKYWAYFCFDFGGLILIFLLYELQE